jgi:hypothetical protein
MDLTDTSPDIERRVAARYAAMTSLERFEIVCSMRQTAITIIESSLRPGLTHVERRYAIAKRLYGDELPEAALIAYANYLDLPNTGLPVLDAHAEQPR